MTSMNSILRNSIYSPGSTLINNFTRIEDGIEITVTWTVDMESLKLNLLSNGTEENESRSTLRLELFADMCSG
ncbi:hypothetical protein Tco_1361633 [Tanacetum coccineum]